MHGRKSVAILVLIVAMPWLAMAGDKGLQNIWNRAEIWIH
jgi:hypothetical protein